MNKESNWTEFLSSVDDKIDPKIFEDFGMTLENLLTLEERTISDFLDDVLKTEKQHKWKIMNALVVKKRTRFGQEEIVKHHQVQTLKEDEAEKLNSNNKIEETMESETSTKKEESDEKKKNITKTAQNSIVSKGILNQIVLVDDYLNSNLKKDFCWKDIPMFSVITGENGVGKSKLLNTILYGYNEKNIKISNVSLEFNEIKQEDIEILALRFNGNEFLPLFHPSEETSNTNFQKKCKEELKKLENYCEKRFKQENFNIDPIYETYWEKVSLLIPGINLKEAVEKVYDNKPISFFKSIENLIFKCLEEIKKQNNEPFGDSLKKLNDFLFQKKFKYKIYFSKDDIKYYDGAEDFNFHKSFGFQDSSMRVDEYIGIGSLSPGEKLQLLLYLWNLTKFNNKAILIFDEFDAHIHPPLIKDLIDIFQNQFVKESGIQVILTTHNPITVSFVPNDCLFVMKYSDESKKLNPTIEKAKSKKDAINLLSSNVVFVNEPFSIVFVEGEKDLQYFQTVSNRLKDLKRIQVSMSFRIHGPKNKDKETSDCKFIINLMEKFEETNTPGIFGMIDGDNKKYEKKTGLFVLERYSVENYIYDPLNLYLQSNSRIRSKLNLKQDSTEQEIVDNLSNIVKQQFDYIFSDKFEQFIERNFTFSTLDKNGQSFKDLCDKRKHAKNTLKVLFGELIDEMKEKIKDSSIIDVYDELDIFSRKEYSKLYEESWKKIETDKKTVESDQIFSLLCESGENMKNKILKSMEKHRKDIKDCFCSDQRKKFEVKPMFDEEKKRFIDDNFFKRKVKQEIFIINEKKSYELKYPELLISLRGHDLQSIYESYFGRFDEGEIKIKAIPNSLVELFENMK
eukprot:gene12996-7733_t